MMIRSRIMNSIYLYNGIFIATVKSLPINYIKIGQPSMLFQR